MRNYVRPLAGAVIAAVLVVSPLSAADAQTRTALTQEEADAQWAQITAYIDAHPGEFKGLEELVQDLTGESLVVQVNGIDEPLSGAEAQDVLDDRAVLPPGAELQSKSTAMSAVPVDAFSVSFAWVPRPSQGLWYPKAGYGTWNFRDDYVNFSAPHDIASLRFEENVCASMTTGFAQTYTYQGVQTNAAYLRDAGLGTNAPIFGIEDSTSGFVGNADNGYALMEPDIQCGPSKFRGMFTYEHNVGQTAISGVSASWLGFGISYNGQGDALQRSSGIAVWDTGA